MLTGSPSSFQAFVKALKGAADPPQQGGLPKIELAWQAWASKTFYLPNKEEVLVGWLLAVLSKEKGSDVSADGPTVASVRHWSLLANILDPTPSWTSSRPDHVNRAWLASLLNRTSVVSTVCHFLNYFATSNESPRDELVEPWARCIRVLWPMALLRTNLDALSACYGNLLAFFSVLLVKRHDTESHSVHIHDIAVLVMSAFRVSFGNAPNKKKMHAQFMQHQLHHWLLCISSHDKCLKAKYSSNSISDSPQTELFASGLEVLFSIDTLRGSDLSESITKLSSSLLSVAQQTDGRALLVLPHIFQEYVSAIRKYRYALFGSASFSGQNQDATLQKPVQEAVMHGFQAAYAVLRGAGDGERVWETMAALARVLEQAGVSLNVEHADAWREIVDHALVGLAASCSDGTNLSVTKKALDLLAIFTRIDFDVVKPFMPSIISAMMKTHSSVNPELLELLQLFLDHHTKARALDIYIKLLLDCLITPPFEPLAEIRDYRQAYQWLSSNALLSMPHLETLRKNVEAFITPEQALNVAQFTLEILGDASSRSQNESLSKDEGQVVSAAVSFALLMKLGAAVLSSLSYEHLPQSSVATVRSSISAAWDGIFALGIEHGWDHIHQDSLHLLWAAHTVSAATLRLRYELTAPSSTSCYLLRSEKCTDVSPHLLKIIKSKYVSPELMVESFRHLMTCGMQAAIDSEGICSAFEILLDYFEDQMKSTKSVIWSGLSCALDGAEKYEDGAAHCFLALWNLTLDRWLPLIDRMALQEQITRLAEMILTYLQVDETLVVIGGYVSPQGVVQRAMSCTVLWELPKLRNALITLLQRDSSFLDNLNMENLLSSTSTIRFESERARKNKKNAPFSDRQIRSTIAVYHFLSLAPSVYLPKSSRSDFFRRALIADAAICMSCQVGDSDRLETLSGWRTLLRSWLHRMVHAFGFVEILIDSSQVLRYLVEPRYNPTDPSSTYITATMGLLSSSYRQLIRLAVHGQEEQLLDVLKGISATTFDTDMSRNHEISQQSAVQLINLLRTECTSSEDLPLSTRASLEKLCQDMNVTLNGQLSSLLSAEVDYRSFSYQSRIMKTWCLCLKLSNFLSLDLLPHHDYGNQLLAKFSSAKYWHDCDSSEEIVLDFHGTLFSLLLTESQLVKGDTDQETRLELITAAYVSFYTKGSSLRVMSECDTVISRAYREMSPGFFEHHLDFVTNTLSRGRLSVDRQHDLVHLSALLIKEAPEGASKMAHRLFEQCLQIFVNDISYCCRDANRSLLALDLIGNQCSNRPASVKPLNMALIWTFLCKLLSGSHEHATHTSSTICRGIVDIISAVVRLRRDLLLLSLPIIGMILRQLLAALRAVRPQLGAKQSQIVTNTLPWWINPTEPLGNEDAKAIARLMTALPTKTALRTHGAMPIVQKAGSLARQFGKHAPYVLMAYAEAMDDPLCTLSSSVRKELEPGLFSLCDMMTERLRDAVMLSANASRQSTLKMVWKEYEKQRYAGTG